MLVVGFLTGGIGYFFARQSLRGVTQPVKNPFLNVEGNDLNRRPQQGADFISEKDILAKVKAQTSDANAKKEKSSDEAEQESKDKAKAESEKKDNDQATSQSFPIKVQNQGMNFEVRSLLQEENNLVLNVALRNGSDKPVQFVYTFLDITDDKGQVLFSEIRGLPTEFKPKGETFFGTIKVLDVSPDSVERISLTLNDYPDQKVKIEVKNIPVLE
ncbi:MAG: hypothetical protein HC934_07850 [Acaryochloridaceae cyanobacterium SU_2_1]|nr:hypothetical protein [Acaryochloridaceae cyanobacterium SU_2_1]NJM95389.1 hypothetical protein [Acaryochloridaceae cyanobacterium CSU_5_19]